MACRKFIGSTWGLKPQVTMWIYKSVIRPIISYGAIALNKCIERGPIRAKLTKLQRLACSMTLGARHSTPTAGMEIILGLYPLDIFMKEKALNDLQRLMEHKQWRGRVGDTPWPKSHTQNLDKVNNKIKGNVDVKDKLSCTHRVVSKFQTVILSRNEISKLNLRPKPVHLNHINCFTDGSKIESRSGAGYTIWGETHLENAQLALGEHTSVFQAEIIAISEAANYLISANATDKIICFYIDSQSAIKALDNYQTKNALVLEGKHRLNTLCLRNKVSLNWVPGHEGHMGNEVADRLAKAGANLPIAGPEPIIAVNQSFTKNLFRTWSQTAQQERWENRKDCRQTKLFFRTINSSFSRTVIGMKKDDLRLLTQIITGHADLNRHNHLMGLADSPICPACEEEEETPLHMLTECPAYAVNRLEILGTHEVKMNDLPDLKAIDLVKFAKSTKRW